ncbi:MAG: hypothetical protein M1608_04750 [Candidatus Omnitrophica bacterium]|nr:hypothetical protein [Candidatus Omnitrophota bacterium]
MNSILRGVNLAVLLAGSALSVAMAGEVLADNHAKLPPDSTFTSPFSKDAEHELIRDPHFQGGFYLLEPKPGKRVVYGELPWLNPGRPVWDLAQWSSRFPLLPADCFSSGQGMVCSNSAKSIVVGNPGSAAADLSLGVNADIEYARARKSPSEPWVHLLVQQDLVNPPALGSLKACRFHMEARLKRSRLVNTNDYSPARHAAQYFVYLTVANRNPEAPGFGECFWFGIPVYDDRHRVVPAYEAQDFGETKLFIYTPASDTFARKSTHDGEWVTFEQDLLPLILEGLEHARAKGFIKGSTELADYRPLGIFIGWEVPGMFDVDLQIRNLSMKIRSRQGGCY